MLDKNECLEPAGTDYSRINSVPSAARLETLVGRAAAPVGGTRDGRKITSV